MTKEEIAQNEQFLLLPQCFLLLGIGYQFNYRDFLFFDKICSKSSAAELSYEGKDLNKKIDSGIQSSMKCPLYHNKMGKGA